MSDNHQDNLVSLARRLRGVFLWLQHEVKTARKFPPADCGDLDVVSFFPEEIDHYLREFEAATDLLTLKALPPRCGGMVLREVKDQ